MVRSNAMFYTGGKTIKNCHKSIIDEQKYKYKTTAKSDKNLKVFLKYYQKYIY